MADVLDGSVDLPGIGQTKKIYVAGGAAIVAVLVGYAYWRRAAAGGGAGEEEAPSYYADTRTGSPDDVVGTSPGGGGGGGGGGGRQDDDVPDTNSAWRAAVLVALNHYEQGYVSSIIGKYLGRIPLTKGEADVVREALAAAGPPPEGQYSIILTTDGSTPGGGDGVKPATPTGVKSSTPGQSSFTLSWSPVTGASSYVVYRDGVNVGSTTDTSMQITGLSSRATFNMQVAAANASGESGKSPVVKVTTAAAPGSGDYIAVRITGRGWQTNLKTIAGHYGKKWADVWNDARNTDLRRRWPSVNNAKVGDTVYIKK